MDITIRPARICDIPEMVDLLEQLFSIETDFTFDAAAQFNGLRQLIDSLDARVLVAESDNSVIGMCSLQILISTAAGGKSGLIEDLIVDQHWRNKGVGTRLLSHVSHLAKQMSLFRLQLLADLNNQSALEFYSHHNWNSTQLICLRQTV